MLSMNRPESNERPLVEKYDDKCDVFILSASALKKLKLSRHNRIKKTYFLNRNRQGNIALHCIDQGTDKWLRKIELDKKFTHKIVKIHPDLITRIKTVADDITLQNAEPVSVEFPGLINLASSYEKVNFKICRGKGAHQKMFAKITQDTYILFKARNGVYDLHYYLADKKIKLHLLTYNKTKKSYKILLKSAQFKDKKLAEEVCITVEGLQNFVHVLSGKRKKTLQQQLKLSHVPKPGLNIYQQAKIVAQNIKIQVDEVFAKVLDEKSYQEYIVAAPKNEQGCYIIPASANENNKMVNYQRILNLLIKLQDFFEKCSRAHILVFQANGTLELAVNTPWLYSAYTQWVTSYCELYDELTPLGVFPFLQNLSTLQGWQDEFGKYIPIDKKVIADQLRINPLYQSYTSNQSSWQNILQGTEEKLIALQKILNDLNSHLPKDGEASETIQKTIDDINIVLAASNRFSNSAKGLWDVMLLVYVVYPKFLTLLKDLPKSLVSLSFVFKDHFFMTAQQINLIFCQIVVNLDQIEITLHLKQHSLMTLTFADMMQFVYRFPPTFSSLLKDLPNSFIALSTVFSSNFSKMMQQANVIFHDILKQNNLGTVSVSSNDSLQSLLTSFNASIEAAGHQFLKHERFPYTHAIIENRNSLLAQGHCDKVMLRERIADLQKNTLKSKSKIKADNRNQYFEQYRIDTFLVLINERIIELQADNSWFTSHEKREIEINLLHVLARKIPTTSSIHIALNEMGEDNSLRQHLSLLWEGKTGVVLRKMLIENQVSPVKIIETIDLEIDKLRAEREQHQLSWSNARRKSIEQSIFALQKFKKALLKPGYLLRNAKNYLNANHPHDYQVLLSQQKALLKELHAIESQFPTDMVKKIPIDYLAVKSPEPSLTEQQITYKYGYVLEEISDRAAELTEEDEFADVSLGAKINKIILLNELRAKLIVGLALEQALEEMANDPQLKDIYYLIREGRTGKMLSKIEYALAADHDKMDYLDVQILRLQDLRSKRGTLIEERIFAITELKRKMQEYPDSSLDQIMEMLEATEVEVLSNYEATVLETLLIWQQAKLEQAMFQSTLPVELIVIPIEANLGVSEEDSPVQAAAVVAPVSQTLAITKMYHDILNNMVGLEAQVGDIFKNILAADIYTEFFEKAAKDEQGKFDLNTNTKEPHWVHQYKQFFNFLISARLCLDQLAKLHIELMQYYDNKAILKLIGNALWGVLGLMEKYKNLYYDLDGLDVLPFLQKLTSQDEIKKIFLDLLPVDANILKNNLEKNSFMRTMQKQDMHWLADSAQINRKLDTFQETLLNLEGSLPSGMVVGAATMKTIKCLSHILKEVRLFAASPCDLLDLIKFIYKVYPFVLELSRNYEQAYAASTVAFKYLLLTALQQLNLVAREIMIGLDKIKLDAFLADGGAKELTAYQFKEGMSINKLFSAFNALVNKMGYQFKKEESSPYLFTLLEKRRVFNFDPGVPMALPIQRVARLQTALEMQQDEKLLTDRMEEEKIANQKNNEIDILIVQRIAQLKAELAKWYTFKGTKTIKINLLRQLRVFLQDHTVAESLVLIEPLLDAKTRPYMHYLFAGRTGEVVRKIQQIQCTPQGALRLIDHEIIRLGHESESFLFFKSKKQCVKELEALKKFKAILAKKGYRIARALTELCGKYPEDYQLVVSTQAKLIAELREIDQQIPDFQVGKITIDELPTLPIREKYSESGFVQGKITARIQSLTAEGINETKTHTIALLTELKNQLKVCLLPEALARISNNKKYSKTFHLLTTGRTGELLKDFENVELTKDDIIARLDAEISYLRNERYTRSNFFVSSTHSQERCITILTELKTRLNHNAMYSIAEFLDNLSVDDRKLMVKREMSLLNELADWQNVQQAVGDYARPVVIL